MVYKQVRLADVLNTDTTLSWMMILEMGILTLKTLKRYCEWLREQVLMADKEVTPEAWRTEFDFYMASSDSPINLSQAASVGTQLYIERKVMRVMCENSFTRLQSGDEDIAEEYEDKLIRICLKELNIKLEEFAETPHLLPREGLLTLK
jgi:hypothetical protein